MVISTTRDNLHRVDTNKIWISCSFPFLGHESSASPQFTQTGPSCLHNDCLLQPTPWKGQSLFNINVLLASRTKWQWSETITVFWGFFFFFCLFFFFVCFFFFFFLAGGIFCPFFCRGFIYSKDRTRHSQTPACSHLKWENCDYLWNYFEC